MTDTTSTQTAATFAANVAAMIDNTLAELEAESCAARDVYVNNCRIYGAIACAEPPADATTLDALKAAVNAAKMAADKVSLRNDTDRYVALVCRLPVWVAEISARYPAVTRGHCVKAVEWECSTGRSTEWWNDLTAKDLAGVEIFARAPPAVFDEVLARINARLNSASLQLRKRSAQEIADKAAAKVAVKKSRKARINRPAAVPPTRPVFIRYITADTHDKQYYRVQDDRYNADVVYEKTSCGNNKCLYTLIGKVVDDKIIPCADSSDDED